jgi:hypothetical protein
MQPMAVSCQVDTIDKSENSLETTLGRRQNH